jgi:hypothetical protein
MTKGYKDAEDEDEDEDGIYVKDKTWGFTYK